MDSCWICDGWNEIDFSWIYGKSGNEYRNPAFIIFDFHAWKGIHLGKIDKISKSFKILRMAPPGPIYFLYAIKMKELFSKKF